MKITKRQEKQMQKWKQGQLLARLIEQYEREIVAPRLKAKDETIANLASVLAQQERPVSQGEKNA